MNKKFKIGIDWHGVLDAIPEDFAWLSRAVVAAGGECHIITGMTWTEECTRQLKEWGVEYTHTFSIFDYHHKIMKTPVSGWHDTFNIPKIDDELWDKTKGEYCKENEISLHLDDTNEYNKYFTTPFARVWTHNNKLKRPHKDKRHLD